MKIGTIGTGFITDWVMSQVLEYHENEYAAVYSRNYETAKKLADKFHVDKIYTDLEAMMSDPMIDCIYVASPNSLHYNHAMMAMKHGKNVIVEKPFASNEKECDEMIEMSKKTGCFLFEAITTVYNPNFLAMKEELKNLGQFKIIECNMSQYSRKYDAFLEGKYPNVFTPKYSGGALMDINIYNLHFVTGLLGMPKAVHYKANIQEGIDTSGVLTLEYDHTIASCVGSKDNIGFNFTQVQAEQGYIISKSASSMTKNVEVFYRNGDHKEIKLQTHQDAHYYYAGEILKMIQNQDRQRCDEMLAHSKMVMHVVDLAKKDAGIVFDADRN